MRSFATCTVPAMWCAILAFSSVTAANIQPGISDAEDISACGTAAHEASDRASLDYVAFGKPQLQEPILGISGISRIRHELKLDKRQAACGGTCPTGYGCCDNNGKCCKRNDPLDYRCYPTNCCPLGMSVDCGAICCPTGTICPKDGTMNCPSATITRGVLATVYSSTTYTSGVTYTSRDVAVFTRTETSVITSTITSAATATDIITITISSLRAGRRAGAIATPAASSVAHHEDSLPSATNHAMTGIFMPSPTPNVEEKIVAAACPRGLPANAADLFRPKLLKRQQVQVTRTTTTGTTTIWSLATITTTTTTRISSSSEITTTTTSTKTTVLSAGTTIKSTTTVNIARIGNVTPGPVSPSPTPTDPVVISSPSTGLSTGAKAGIGGGIGVAAAIILVLAFLLFKKRKNRSDDHADPTINQPVSTSPPYNPAMAAVPTTTYYGNDTTKSMRSSSVVSPPYSAVGYPPSSPTLFSPAHSPGPIYEAPSEGRTTPYNYPPPSEHGNARPYVYQPVAPQGEPGIGSPESGYNHGHSWGHGHEHEMYSGPPPQELGHGTPAMGYAQPQPQAGAGYGR
ncbi:hypothetical protein CC86DRAFT_109555 [Ophiobolus disseminans]|uniref:Uncharacterized protein n=1 Tax=Ophiobolus disseminans TaxID=1469910 RepID=A0A6A6ZJR8_9PLEO|nr:hypothetical protein CC86DRAFT_109555 [Ophiobolus disseminans]